MKWFFGIILLIGAVVYYLLQQGGLGFSPQAVEIPVGSTRTVANGRAQIWFEEADLAVGEGEGVLRDAARIQVSCKDDGEEILVGTFPSKTVCGIRVRLITLEKKGITRQDLHGKFKVSWDD